MSDGDTLTALVDRQQIRVRIVDIDAPESKQPWGNRSRQSLASICHRQHAEISVRGKDRYGRTLARVSCAGTDAATHQVTNGMAWVFVRYAPPDSPLYAIEAQARDRRSGLWSDPTPVAPWEWRAGQR